MKKQQKSEPLTTINLTTNHCGGCCRSFISSAANMEPHLMRTCGFIIINTHFWASYTNGATAWRGSFQDDHAPANMTLLGSEGEMTAAPSVRARTHTQKEKRWARISNKTRKLWGSSVRDGGGGRKLCVKRKVKAKCLHSLWCVCVCVSQTLDWRNEWSADVLHFSASSISGTVCVCLCPVFDITLTKAEQLHVRHCASMCARYLWLGLFLRVHPSWRHTWHANDSPSDTHIDTHTAPHSFISAAPQIKIQSAMLCQFNLCPGSCVWKQNRWQLQGGCSPH